MTKTPFEYAADIFDPPGPRYDLDPIAWCESKGIFLWSKQKEIISGLVTDDVAVHSCHNIGKSFTAAAAAAWWLDSHPPGQAFVVTTAPTGHQVKAVLWREIGKLHGRPELGLPGRVNMTEWYIGQEIVAFGRKPNDYEPTAFQGIHARYVLVILDEACGIPQQLWDAASSLASNEFSRQLAIGNPDDPQTEFRSVCEPGSGWHVVHVGWEHTPNATGEKVPKALREVLISERWVRSRQKRWTEESPVYISKVQGLFPTDATDGVIPHGWATQCRYLELGTSAEVEVEGGLDPARGGEDKAVLWVRRGPVAVTKYEWPYTPDPKDLAEKALEVVQNHGIVRLKIDAEGLGWGISGILDTFKEQGRHSCQSIPVYTNIAADDAEKFHNRRAEIWWGARERSRLAGWDLGVVEDDDIADLCAPRYFTDAKGRTQIEKKEDIKKRLGRSPDSGDALILAYLDVLTDAQVYGNVLTSIRLPGVRR